MNGRKWQFMALAKAGVDLAAAAIVIKAQRRTLTTIPRDPNYNDVLPALSNAGAITNNTWGAAGGAQSANEDALEIRATVEITTTGSPSGTVEIWYHESHNGGATWPGNGLGYGPVATVVISGAGTTAPLDFAVKY
jgi:hypothetical protein